MDEEIKDKDSDDIKEDRFIFEGFNVIYEEYLMVIMVLVVRYNLN